MTLSAKRKARTSRQQKQAKGNAFSLWLVVGGLVVIAVIAAVIIFREQNRQVATPTVDVPAAWVNGTSLGDPNAPVSVQAWEDFLCPHCQDWTAQVEPQLIDDYVKTGKVQFTFKSLPLQGFEPGSSMGAQASLCAADQGAFWPFHDRLFTEARSRNQSAFTLDALAQSANSVGLNSTEFMQCMSSQQYRATIDDLLQEAASLQLTATPSILINGKRIENPFDYVAIKTEIDGLLANQ